MLSYVLKCLALKLTDQVPGLHIFYCFAKNYMVMNERMKRKTPKRIAMVEADVGAEFEGLV